MHRAMNETKRMNSNDQTSEELTDEQLDGVSGGITPIPIPGAIVLNTDLLKLSQTSLEYAATTITRSY